ncbi:MAG: polymer-forming cytoskeletal protein [Bacteroidales bacterium]|nr:polymer-forming cytoskeletal protein [Bacteroidales bacterium]
MGKVKETEPSSVNLLGVGTKIKGDINTNGDFRVDGALIGTIITKGKIIVGESGSIEGEIKCKNADISGVIKAKITVAELLTLKSSSKFSGEVYTNKIAIEPGANFSGSCNMDDVNNGSVIKMQEKKN